MTLLWRNSSMARSSRSTRSRTASVRQQSQMKWFPYAAVHPTVTRAFRCSLTTSSLICLLRQTLRLSEAPTPRQAKRKIVILPIQSRLQLLHSRLQQTRSSVSSASSEFIQVLFRQVQPFTTLLRTQMSVSDVSFRCTLTTDRILMLFTPVISPLP